MPQGQSMHAQPRNATPNRNKKTATMHPAHRHWDTPTSLIGLLWVQLIVSEECFDLALMWAITDLFLGGHFRSFAKCSLATPTSGQRHAYGFIGHVPHDSLIKLAIPPPKFCADYLNASICSCVIQITCSLETRPLPPQRLVLSG